MNEQICKCGARLEAFRYSSHSTKHYWAKVGTGEVCINDHWHEPAEPSPGPEAAPASEAQAGTSALYVTKAAYNVRLAELAQLRARAAILDAQEDADAAGGKTASIMAGAQRL